MDASRKARWLTAADLIRRFATGELSNDEFEAAYEDNGGDDQVLFEIGLALWRFYDDVSTHRLGGRHTLSPDAQALFARCVLLLETQDAYRWPMNPPMPFGERLGSWWKQVRGEALPPLPAQPAPPAEEGEPKVWPFYLAHEHHTASQMASGQPK